MTSLIQPLAIWNGIPSHSITQILLDFENNLLVSGGKNGQLLLWEISKSEDDQMIFYNIQPKTVLFGHSTEITCITLGSYDWREVIVSISIDGSICIWDIHGLCVASENNVLTIPRPAHAVLLSDNRHIACAGYSADIEIVDLWSLNVVATLSGIHQDWITSLYPIKNMPENDGIPMLVSSCIDGEIVIWSLDLSKKQIQYKTPENLKKNSMSSISLKPHSECVPFSSLIVENASPINVEISNNMKTILVVCVDKWFLYSAFNPRQLFEMPAPEDKPIIGGSFVNYNRVIIWNKERAFVYYLPNQDKLQVASFVPPQISNNETIIQENVDLPKTLLNKKKSFFKEKPKKKDSEQKAYKTRSGILFERRESVFDMVGKKNYEDEVIDNSIELPTIIQEFQYLYSSNEESSKEDKDEKEEVNVFSTSNGNKELKPLLFSAGRSFGGWFGIGTIDSRVALWKIQKTISTEKTTTVLPRTVCILDESWEGVTPTQSKVTDSLVFEDRFLLIRGHENGEITISKIPSNTEKPFSLQNSHSKKVNCLWRPAKTSNLRNIFLSTSADFLIKIWDIESKSLLYTFCQHTAPVTHILGPPERKATEKRWTNVFFTVALDKSVGMFSLDNFDCKYLFSGHPDLIDTVRWRVDQDYLVVGSIDGTVSVWDLTTGELEQSIHNQEAENILETCFDLMNVNTLEHRFLNKSIYAHSYHLSNSESPVQILQLNIQSLLQDLIRTLKRGKESPHLSRVNVHINEKDNKENGEKLISREELLKTTKAFKIYTYFLPWFENQESLTKLCESNLLLKPPDPLISFGMRGENGKLSFLVPRYSKSSEKWQYSSHLTALMCLCSVTLSHAFLDLSTEKNINNQILSYYCTLLPETVEGYVEPSLSFLANFWQDSMLDIKQSARSVFNSTLERVDTQFQLDFSNDFAKQLTSPIKVGSSSRAHAVLVLAILGSQKSDSLEDPVKKLVAQELMALLFQQNDKTHQIAAAELLGKGYSTWSKDLPEPSILFQKMFKLCLSNDTNIVGVATSSITSVGVHHPLQFITSLSDDLFKNESSIKEHAAALRIIRELVYKNPFCLYPHLSKLVHSVVLSLDPSIPNLRDGTIRSTTSLLQMLVKKYPMVSFHQTSQHLALGTTDTNILIYNLKSATLWHTLEGHKGTLTAVSFSEDGKFLASYSYQESIVKIWSVTSSFFGLGSSPKCINTQAVPNNSDVKASSISVSTLLEQVHLKWEGPKQIVLIRAWMGSLQIKF